MIRTWHIELAIVAALTIAVSLAGGGPIELVGAFAVTLSFAHGQVADRLAEREAARTVAGVHCYRWATRYFVGKEALWCLYFIAHRGWSALVGVALFLIYPVWRRFWRARKPLAAA